MYFHFFSYLIPYILLKIGIHIFWLCQIIQNRIISHQFNKFVIHLLVSSEHSSGVRESRQNIGGNDRIKRIAYSSPNVAMSVVVGNKPISTTTNSARLTKLSPAIQIHVIALVIRPEFPTALLVKLAVGNRIGVMGA